MSVHLIFLFFFQGGLAFAFSLFIVRVLLNGLTDDALKQMRKGIRKIRLLTLAAAVFFPVVMFFAYYKSLPDGQSVALAVWPAAWILVIMLALVGGISIGLNKSRTNT